jgi:hypothetical protein
MEPKDYYIKLVKNLLVLLKFFTTHHLISGFGSPTQRHSKDIRSSSNCLITGRSVNVGLHPSSGTGASSPYKFS